MSKETSISRSLNYLLLSAILSGSLAAFFGDSLKFLALSNITAIMISLTLFTMTLISFSVAVTSYLIVKEYICPQDDDPADTDAEASTAD